MVTVAITTCPACRADADYAIQCELFDFEDSGHRIQCEACGYDEDAPMKFAQLQNQNQCRAGAAHQHKHGGGATDKPKVAAA
jgi:hypothetical protein